MTNGMWRPIVIAVFVLASLGGPRAPVAQTAGVEGQALYLLLCASCHGVSGRGDGPDASLFVPPPPDLHAGFLARHDTTELVRRIREGQPLEITLDVSALRARAGEVETLVAHLKRLPDVDWGMVQRGRSLYFDRCAACHGSSGHPVETPPPGVRSPCDLADVACQRSLSDKELATAVRHGHQHMPALTPRIAAEDAPPLAAFVRLLSPGYEIYTRHCASCHGDDGRGRTSVVETIQLPTMVFNRDYFKRRDPDQLRAPIWHMVAEQTPKMPHYRSILDDARARAIVEYLKASPH